MTTTLTTHEQSLRDHQVKGAVRSFKMAVAALERGYRFDDATAGEKIALLQRALKTIDDFVTGALQREQ